MHINVGTSLKYAPLHPALDGMECERIRVTNIGPVTDGEIALRKVMVFIGPNGTGKSIVSRIIHALHRLGPPSSLLRHLGRSAEKKVGGDGLLRLYGEAVLVHSALERDGIVTHGRKSCSLTVSRGQNMPDLDICFEPPDKGHSAYVDMLCDPRHTGKAQCGGVYIPGGRVGTVQAFTDMARLKAAFVEFAHQSSMRHAKEAPAEPPAAHPPGREGVMRLPPLGRLPPHIGQFHDLVAQTITGGPSGRLNRSLSRVFGVTVGKHPVGKAGQTHAAYRDPRGHKTPIGSAGSGLLASAPILAGLHYVKAGGTLIVEEPEAHVEPSTQIALIDEMTSTALSKGVRLVLTTHSDYIVKKILALVASRKIRPSDIGLYYFCRDAKYYTRIKQVPVDPVGAADQELFKEALDSLVEEFSA